MPSLSHNSQASSYKVMVAMDSLCKATACRSSSRQPGACSLKLKHTVNSLKDTDSNRCKRRLTANSLLKPRLTDSPFKATDNSRLRVMGSLCKPKATGNRCKLKAMGNSQFRDMASQCKATDSSNNRYKAMECLSSSRLLGACSSNNTVSSHLNNESVRSADVP